MEQREVETPGSAWLPQCLDLHYKEDFLKKRSHQVSAVFSDQLFIPSMANAVYKAFKSEPKESTPSTSKTSQWIQEQVTEAPDTDSDKTDELTPEKEPPPRDLKVKITRRLRKHGSKAMTGSSKDGVTPSKVRKELEAGDVETTASTRPSEATLKTARFEQYDKDLPEVKEVCARILGLPEGEEATQEDFDSLPDFQLRRAINEAHPLSVIGEHWIDHLDSKGHLAKCKPNAFKYEDEWLPLYTRAGVTKQISGLGPLLNTQGDSPLIAVIPPDMPFQYEREYVIHWLHKAECLARMSVYYDDNQQKQIAFCPYCGVMNKNSATAYSHARKHLGITFLCGGCYGKFYKALQHLFNHMKTCHPCVMSRLEGSLRGGKGK